MIFCLHFSYTVQNTFYFDDFLAQKVVFCDFLKTLSSGGNFRVETFSLL